MADREDANTYMEVSPPDSGDVEAGHLTQFEDDDDDEEFKDNPFDIANTKNAPHESLRRWRVRNFYQFLFSIKKCNGEFINKFDDFAYFV